MDYQEYQLLPNQDPNAPPSYLPHAANQPLHYNPLPPNTTYGSLVATPNYATNPANGADNDDYNWTMSCVTILLCFICGGWLSLPLSCMAVRISVSAKEAARRGDAALAQQKAMYALLLNAIAVILYVYVAMTVLSVMYSWYRWALYVG
ncbi:hypothetical protein EMCRGX_G007165 [Ephydatia muelleri]